MRSNANKDIGIYVHIPFCASKCAYCAFCSVAGHDDWIKDYKNALVRHIKESGPQLMGYIADTVYFGGGTPSYFGTKNIIAVLNALKQNGRILVDSEITMEANPDSITKTDLIKLHQAGVNRLSIGMQSANDGLLKSLGRRHNFAQVEEAVAMARKAGFDNVSLDLIYGLPSQTKEDWADTLSKAVRLKPEHISCYGLAIEEGTPLYEFKDSPFIPDDDTQADMYLYTVEALERYGYRQYEISNFSLRGYESKHNLKYWQGKEYVSFGAAAHSYLGGYRYSYTSDIRKYIDGIMSGEAVIDQNDRIDRFERSCEYLLLGLRTCHGISEEEYRSIFPCSFQPALELLNTYRKQGWVLYNDGRWSFTPSGFLLSNTLIGNIIDAQASEKLNVSTPWKSEPSEYEYQYTMFKNTVYTQLFHGI
jgi:oxygen-independent coproporphyrinogen-3 oxidase